MNNFSDSRRISIGLLCAHAGTALYQEESFITYVVSVAKHKSKTRHGPNQKKAILQIMDTIKFNYQGTEREALVGLIGDVEEIIYRVTLDDGYENNFFVSFDQGVWFEGNLGNTELANIVGEAIENHFG